MDISSSINTILFILLFTGFVKALLTVTLLGHGLGISGFAYSVLSTVLALVLSLIMLKPVLSMNEFSSFDLFSNLKLSAETQGKLQLFLERNTEPEVKDAVQNFAASLQLNDVKQDFEIASLGFILTEIKEGFFIGALILLPFLLIDFLLALIFSAVGIQVLSVKQVSLPLKLLLFISVDGWLLLSGNFFNNYSW